MRKYSLFIQHHNQSKMKFKQILSFLRLPIYTMVTAVTCIMKNRNGIYFSIPGVLIDLHAEG